MGRGANKFVFGTNFLKWAYSLSVLAFVRGRNKFQVYWYRDYAVLSLARRWTSTSLSWNDVDLCLGGGDRVRDWWAQSATQENAIRERGKKNVISKVKSWNRPRNVAITCRIIEYFKLEGILRDHCVQLLAIGLWALRMGPWALKMLQCTTSCPDASCHAPSIPWRALQAAPHTCPSTFQWASHQGWITCPWRTWCLSHLDSRAYL